MKRPWRFVIEVGQQESTPTSERVMEVASAPDTTKAWELLVDARKKLADAMANKADDKVTATNSWIGGGLATMAAITGESAEALLGRLKAEVPISIPQSPYDKMGTFVDVSRPRAQKPPGAQRKLDPAELTEEEREYYGIVLPEKAED